MLGHQDELNRPALGSSALWANCQNNRRKSWIVHWLRALKQAHIATEEELGSEVDPDFLLPCLPPLHSQEQAIFAEPMSYQQALHAMRWAMTLPWEANQTPALPEEAAAFTLHSLKTSLLSAANQLRLPEEDRRHQGHHKKDSVTLYGRDDTIHGLWVQQQIAIALSRNWRPSRPIARGGQRPTVEPASQRKLARK